MNVRELIERLQAMPDQDATVVIAEGVHAHLWLIVSGLIPRDVKRTAHNPDQVELSLQSKLFEALPVQRAQRCGLVTIAGATRALEKHHPHCGA